MSDKRSLLPKSPERITEQENPFSVALDAKSTVEILRIINREDRKVALAVARVIPQIARAVDLAVAALSRGGRLIYLGTGTSGRLGVLDASECLPTFGSNQVLGIVAGGASALLSANEGSEDDPRQAVQDLRKLRLSRRDVVVGISASGRTPYTLGGIRCARQLRAGTIGLTSNPRGPIRQLVDVAIVPVVGPEVIAGSTRMKAGTAAKLVLNMLSTATMVRLGRVLSNWMVHVQLTNEKLRQRGLTILMKATGARRHVASQALHESRGELPVAMLMLWKQVSKRQARELLRGSANPARVLREAWASQLRART